MQHSKASNFPLDKKTCFSMALQKKIFHRDKAVCTGTGQTITKVDLLFFF